MDTMDFGHVLDKKRSQIANPTIMHVIRMPRVIPDCYKGQEGGGRAGVEKIVRVGSDDQIYDNQLTAPKCK